MGPTSWRRSGPFSQHRVKQGYLYETHVPDHSSVARNGAREPSIPNAHFGDKGGRQIPRTSVSRLARSTESPSCCPMDTRESECRRYILCPRARRCEATHRPGVRSRTPRAPRARRGIGIGLPGEAAKKAAGRILIRCSRCKETRSGTYGDSANSNRNAWRTDAGERTQ